MSVAIILKEKGSDVVTVSPEDTLSSVASTLAAKKIGAAVVLDDGKVCGIASERDIIREIAASGANALDQPISKCMTKKVVDCHPDDSIDAVMGLMTAGRFRHVPVTENGKLAGLISIGDVVKRKIEQAEQDAEDMKRYIAG